MTAITLSRLPLQAGSALAAGAGRALRWGIASYSRAPLANTSILALTVFTAMAGSNALYLQDSRHPAPLFGPAPDMEIGLPDPVTPATRKSALTVPDIVVIDETTGSIPAAPVVPQPEPIGNAEIISLQRKLTTLGLYEGKVDGVFGPKTAGAIRRFEERTGLPAKGALTPDIIDAVASAPIVLPQADATPLRPIAVLPLQTAAEQPTIIVVPPTASAPVATAEVTGSIPPANVGNQSDPKDAFQPLPDPAPLQLSLQSATQPQPILRPTRDMPDSPREVLNLAVATARNGIQALASVIENGPQLGPSTPSAIAPATPIPATQSIAPPAQVPEMQTAAAIQGSAVQTAAIQQPMPPLPAAAAPSSDQTNPVMVAETVPVIDTPAPSEAEPLTDRELVAKVQRGLSSLGFLRGEVDGVAGEATAKAIRNFEVYYNYNVTGRVTPGLVDLLVSAGAQI